jgi:hypothetical protein
MVEVVMVELLLATTGCDYQVDQVEEDLMHNERCKPRIQVEQEMQPPVHPPPEGNDGGFATGPTYPGHNF